MIDVTQESLHLLLPGKVADVAAMYAESEGISPIKALEMFYRSETYRRLEDENTKHWHLGPVALWEEFSDEAASAASRSPRM